ncbi:hypothetical protein DRJ48_05360 [Candidatus Woesearchaeota archaeon]|nr:hypothetical protein [Candidatus Woesearchaeota archaeon]RLE41543.1 MAG: hypothetical protein DRJ48_05360 [Candidatus Woesearchaeota archaeon]
MKPELSNRSVKLLMLLVMLVLSISLVSGATYLPSTKYINIQTEFTQLTVTLEKFARVDFIAHCPGFNSSGCPQWNIYNTTIVQNSTHVTFDVYDKGAYIGIHSPQITAKKNLTQIKRLLEQSKGITINKLNLTARGLYLEFVLPLKGIGNVSIKQVKDAVVVIDGLKNESMLKNAERVKLDKIVYNNQEIELKTDVVAIEAENFTQATIKLPKEGAVNTIMKCVKWDFNTSSCNAWTATNIPFKQDSNYVYFNVTGFSAYGGVELTLLNVQSYPQVGDYWTVKFLTKGTANLTIEGANGTLYGVDIEFAELRCGDSVVDVESIENGIFVADYSCNETSYHKVKVLTAGKHTQKFTFGTIVRYARNLANNMPQTLSVEGKLTNASNDNLNGTYNMTFRIYDVPTGGTRIWEENKTNVSVDDGIFSVVLGTTEPLTLNFNEPYYLAIMIEGDTEMSPRINLTSTPYARSAERSFNLSCTDCIDETQIDTSGEFIIEGNLNMTGGVVNMLNHKIINLATPTADTDAATKAYVDSQIGSGGGAASGWNDTGTLVDLITGTDSVNATTLFINNTAGRVGIGTYSPSEKLSVNGNLEVTGNITSTNYGIRETSNAIVISASGNKKLIFTTNVSRWI